MRLSSSYTSNPLDCDTSTDHLQNSLTRISSWMTANLLTLNCLRLNFCSLVLVNNLPKIHNSSLNTTYSTRNLSFIFDEHLTFFDQISSVSKSCYYHIRQPASLYPSIHRCQKGIHFHCSLQARLLQLSLSQPAEVSDHPSPTDPPLSCMCCCQSSQIQSHHSHPSVSALVKDN